MKYNVGIILDSGKAFEAYYDATGTPPPPMEEGKNTRIIPFTVDDGTGPKAALLVHQTGFEQTATEREKGQEANGLSVAVCMDAPTVEEGAQVLNEWAERFLWPEDGDTP